MRHNNLPLTPGIVAAGIDQYVGVQLTELQENDQPLNYDILLQMCSPQFNWEQYVPINYSYEVLKELFTNPKFYFYRTTPGVYEYHNPELKHALRRILLRRLLKADNPSSNILRAQVPNLLTQLSTEFSNLGRNKKIWGREQLELVLPVIIKIVIIDVVSEVLRPTSSAKWIERPLFLNFLVAFIGIPILLRDIILIYKSIKQALPPTIQLGTSLNDFSTFQTEINRLLQALSTNPAERKDSDEKQQLRHR